MSRENIKNAVVDFLKEKNYSYLKPLGEGGFASVIAFLSPQNETVAVKIVEKKFVRKVEDEIWPWLSHRNILPLLDVLNMDSPDVKLYITPMMPKALDESIHSSQFRMDRNGLTKIKLWMYDVLLGLNSLHSSGLCHGDLKTDNVLIDEDERAVLCDFSGLNHTGKPMKNLCSPLIFRPPECFNAAASENIQGVPYDMYTFGLAALNMLTGHYPQMELMKNDNGNWDWSTYVWPILQKVLKRPTFEYFMRRSLPYSNITERDIEQGLDFIQRMLKITPGERPLARDMMKHPFLKMGGNPFISKNENGYLSKGDNPFKKVDDSGKQVENIQHVRPGVKFVMSRKMVTNNFFQATKEEAEEPRLGEVIQEAPSPKALKRYLTPPVKQFASGDCAEEYHPWERLLKNESSETMYKKKGLAEKKSLKQKVTDWFRKKVKKYKKA